MKIKAISLFVLLSLAGSTAMHFDVPRPEFKAYNWEKNVRWKKNIATALALLFGYKMGAELGALDNAGDKEQNILACKIIGMIAVPIQFRLMFSYILPSDYEVKVYMRRVNEFLNIFKDSMIQCPVSSFSEFVSKNYSDKENSIIFVNENLIKMKKKSLKAKEVALEIKSMASKFNLLNYGWRSDLDKFMKAIDWTISDIEAKLALVSAES